MFRGDMASIVETLSASRQTAMSCLAWRLHAAAAAHSLHEGDVALLNFQTILDDLQDYYRWFYFVVDRRITETL